MPWPMSSGWTWAARSPMPSSTTTRAPCSRRSRPSTPPDYSRGVLDVLELLAEQLGRPLPEMLADTHHIAHGTTSSLNALVTGNVPAGRLPHHQGPPRLDLHHERRGPLPRPFAARAADTSSARPSTTRCCPSGTRWRSPSGSTATARRRRPRRGRRPARRSARCSPTGCARSRCRCCGRSATRRTSGGCASWSREADPDVFVALSSARSARGSGSSPATPPRS